MAFRDAIIIGDTDVGKYVRVPGGTSRRVPCAVLCPYCEVPLVQVLAEDCQFGRVIQTIGEKAHTTQTKIDLIPESFRLLACSHCDGRFTQPTDPDVVTR